MPLVAFIATFYLTKYFWECIQGVLKLQASSIQNEGINTFYPLGYFELEGIRTFFPLGHILGLGH